MQKSTSDTKKSFLDRGKLEIWGYKNKTLKFKIFAYFLYIVSFGMLRLIFYWKPLWHAVFMYDSCGLQNAEIILIWDNGHHLWTLRSVINISAPPGVIITLPCQGGQFTPVSSYRCFTYRKKKFITHPNFDGFSQICCLDEEIPCNQFRQWSSAKKGLSELAVENRRIVYGLNSTTTKLKPIILLLFREALNPFYVFQAFSVTLWYFDGYILYSTALVLMSVVSISLDVYQTRQQEKSLLEMVNITEDVTAIRDGAPIVVKSTGLVPGDLIHIPTQGCVMQCDAVLLNGTCVLNESMLTGESVLVTKTQLPYEVGAAVGTLYDQRTHAKHTLYCGTQIVQTRHYVGHSIKAMVIRTGYTTSKGQLIRSIMYPKPVDFRFTKDLFTFVGVMFVIAGLGFVYGVIIMIKRDAGIEKIIVRSLDLITIAVSPVLPAAMTIGIIAAQKRLKKQNIFCISPSTINTCGGINLVCFDKTGTLTEDGLDFHCVVPVYNSGFEVEQYSLCASFPDDDALLKALGSCHSLSRIKGHLQGNPMDMILFKKTNWIFDEEPASVVQEIALTVVHPPQTNAESPMIAIIRQFTFSSALQRMSVVTKDLRSHKNQLILYAKGAPETIASLCRPDTIPESFHSVIEWYGQRGYRLIAVAHRQLNVAFSIIHKVSREEVERNMDFLGLVVLENKLKSETQPVIKELSDASIRTVMVTGDNILTAVSVAKECHMLNCDQIYILDVDEQLLFDDYTWKTLLKLTPIEGNTIIDKNYGKDVEAVKLLNTTSRNYQLAITGKAFGIICKQYPDLISNLICTCDVFARMSPKQKAKLINYFQEVQYTVAMCGDGANDCGALKAAHAGISLSEAEASIASPFTSKTPNIRCVPTVIREGQAALVNSFGVFKYMAGYSLCLFSNVSILYWISTSLSNAQFLYADIIITIFAAFFSYTDAAENLAPHPPPIKILSLPSVMSVVGQFFFIFISQLFIFWFVSIQPWFIPFTNPYDHKSYHSYQLASVFSVSLFQYIALVIIYSKGLPYRKPLITNRPLSISLILCTLVSLIITVYPPVWIANLMDLNIPPFIMFNVFVVFVAILSGVVGYLFESYIVDWFLLEMRKKKHWCGAGKPTIHESILHEIGHNITWLSRVTGATLKREKKHY